MNQTYSYYIIKREVLLIRYWFIIHNLNATSENNNNNIYFKVSLSFFALYILIFNQFYLCNAMIMMVRTIE